MARSVGFVFVRLFVCVVFYLLFGCVGLNLLGLWFGLNCFWLVGLGFWVL